MSVVIAKSSLHPEHAVKLQPMFPDVIKGTVVLARFGGFKYPKIDSRILVWALWVQPEEEQAEGSDNQHDIRVPLLLSCGSLDKNVPSNDGINPVDEFLKFSDKNFVDCPDPLSVMGTHYCGTTDNQFHHMNNNTACMEFIRRSQFPRERLDQFSTENGTSGRFIEGLRCIMERVPKEDQKSFGASRQRVDDKPRMIHIVTSIIGWNGDVPHFDPFDKSSSAPARSEASLDDEIKSRVEAEILSSLPSQRSSLLSIAGRFPEHVSPVIELINSDWMTSEDRPWTVSSEGLVSQS